MIDPDSGFRAGDQSMKHFSLKRFVAGSYF